MVGGELELSSFDLSYRDSSKVYQAPLQLTANGGLLIIDDFGRQKCSPVAMLNRWITPLESRIDFLTLQTGQKVVVPFAVLVVFATNIRPSELLDEAFLRRIRYKVFAESPTLDDFKEIFRQVLRRPRARLRGIAGRRPGAGRVRAARHPAARHAPARSDRSGDVARRLPEPATPA